MSSRKIVIGLAVLCGLIAIGFWLFPKADYAAMADDNVAERWIPGREQVDAIPFFEAGGNFIDFDDELSDGSIDSNVVLPLIQRLTSEANMHWTVLLDEKRKGQAFAILAKLPTDSADLKSMDRIIAEQEAQFDGKFIEQRGYEWLSFEFLSAEDVAILEGDE